MGEWDKTYRSIIPHSLRMLYRLYSVVHVHKTSLYQNTKNRSHENVLNREDFKSDIVVALV